MTVPEVPETTVILSVTVLPALSSQDVFRR
jgi:hypothetical protein